MTLIEKETTEISGTYNEDEKRRDIYIQDISKANETKRNINKST